MSTDFLKKIKDLQALFTDCCHQAEEIRQARGGRPSTEEGELRVKAASAARELMQMTDGAVRNKYSRAYAEQKRIAGRIVEELEKEAADAASARSEKAEANRPQTGKKEAEAVKEGAVDPSGWYRERPSQGFDDVSGMQELKDRLWGIVERMKHKALMNYLKINQLNGFLFYGPPGCGKTYLTEAFVHELMGNDYKYLSLDAKDIHSKYSGESEKIVGAVFEEARSAAPSLLFFDEMDAVCTDRQQPDIPQHTKSLTDAFLTSYNHLKSSDSQVFLIGATNYPQNVDPAMISRMELIRIPLPDEAARVFYFDHAFKDSNLFMGPDLTASYMAGLTESYSYRDLEHLLAYIKGQIMNKVMHLGDEEGIREMQAGKYPVTKEGFEQALRTVLPSYDAKYMQALEKWEEDKGIKAAGGSGEDKEKRTGSEPGEDEEKRTGSEPGEDKGEQTGGGSGEDNGTRETGRPGEDGGVDAASKTQGNVTGGMALHNSYEAGTGFNNHPFTDIFFAYSFSKKVYKKDSLHRMESISRVVEVKSRVDLGHRVEGYDDRPDPSFLNRVEKESYDYDSSLFGGFLGSEYIRAYDGYNTGAQGSARPDFQGTCGVISSCNIVNQQTGSRLAEKDGIGIFVKHFICGAGFKNAAYNGMTSAADREKFLDLYGIKFICCVSFPGAIDYRNNSGLNPGTIYGALLNGWSVMVGLKAQDLREIGLSKRIINNDGKLLQHEDNQANHSVTVAGCSTDMAGSIIGLWINDTGRWTDSNRVFITVDKWCRMVEQTIGFTVEYCVLGGKE